jgi:hypothetical protein
MKNKERERQPRYKKREASTKKTPLTFYRSSDTSLETGSPFKQKELHPSVSKIRSFFAAFLDAVIIVALLLLLVYSLIIRPDAKVQLNSELFHSASEYQTAANKILKGIKNGNKVTFSGQDVEAKLEKQFPEIASASIELPLVAQTPIVHLKIASPSFVINSKGHSYIVDSDGVAVADATNFPKARELLSVDDQSGFTDQLGKQVMSAASVQFINTVTEQGKRAKVPISSLTLPNSAQQLNLRTSDRPYYIKFFLGGDPLLQSGQFLASRQQFDSSNSQAAEYLDVRISGKVFYK